MPRFRDERLSLRLHIFHACQQHCCYCGESLVFDSFTLDHIIPVAQGGSTHETNLVAACVKCNQRKGCRLLDDYLTEHPEAAHAFVRFAFSAGRRPRQLALLIATHAAA
jgi:5-methylcytosine-specific restriction endonuclease McrA